MCSLSHACLFSLDRLTRLGKLLRLSGVVNVALVASNQFVLGDLQLFAGCLDSPLARLVLFGFVLPFGLGTLVLDVVCRQLSIRVLCRRLGRVLLSRLCRGLRRVHH